MSNTVIKSADFKLFVVLWNQKQDQKTPLLHLKMAEWLETAWINDDKRLLLMAFRSAGKSSIVGLFAAWLIYRNPNIRILVLAADFTLAKKMVRNVKRIIESHPLTPHLKPDNADQWASDRFTVNRTLELRDPTMMAKGVTSNITGSRADIVICDDVEVPNTCDSAEKREDLRERLSEILYVLVSGGTQLYVGTPHHYYSIYADVARWRISPSARPITTPITSSHTGRMGKHRPSQSVITFFIRSWNRENRSCYPDYYQRSACPCWGFTSIGAAMIKKP